jgi:hypothetical protein
VPILHPQALGASVDKRLRGSLASIGAIGAIGAIGGSPTQRETHMRRSIALAASFVLSAGAAVAVAAPAQAKPQLPQIDIDDVVDDTQCSVAWHFSIADERPVATYLVAISDGPKRKGEKGVPTVDAQFEQLLAPGETTYLWVTAVFEDGRKSATTSASYFCG